MDLFLDFTAIGHLNLGTRASTLASFGLNLVQHFFSTRQLSKHGMTAIEPRRIAEANEELGSIGVLNGLLVQNLTHRKENNLPVQRSPCSGYHDHRA
jgi:hypothetical protein